ncbi:MAG: SusD/RagB family nutrient-binding outer membrane lipoprotein [Puia sp.]|nr:SusD/RagB family nutrient-binding outer membrane lipoprotein [Puia sp.]
MKKIIKISMVGRIPTVTGIRKVAGIKKVIVAVLMTSVASSLLVSCTKNITSLNNNPKASLSAPSASVFVAGEKALVDLYTTEFWGSAPFRVVAQVWSENTFAVESNYKFATNNAPGGWWTNIYTNALSNLAQAKSLYSTDVQDPDVLRNDLIVTDILEVYAYSLLVNTYGNIPYSQALNRTIPFPKYDDAKTVEYDLLQRLDTAIAGLNTSAGSLGSADQFYHGNTAQWKKFAATLKLKLALLIADTDPTTGATKAQEAIATGVFQSNADNAVFDYDPSAVVNSNPLWQDLVNGANLHYYSPSSYFINTLVSWNDPRLPLLFTKDPNNQYSGGIAGGGNSSTQLSSFSAQWLSAGFPGDLLDYSETSFLLAEATERGISTGSTAEIYYDSAVSASIQYWGGSYSDVLAYLSQPAVAYSTATGTWRQKIGYQKWIAFANRNWDSWTEIRRLGYPDINTVSPPVAAITAFPLRFYYPPAEQTSNNKNWAAAVAALPGGADVVTAKLFWQP